MICGNDLAQAQATKTEGRMTGASADIVDADVVVVGSGVAGLSAAIASARLGMKTVLLEKHDKVGGSTSYSWGLLWAAPTHIAQAAGEEDNIEDVLAYMNFLSGGEADAARMEAFIRESPGALKFFEEAGLELQLTRGLPDHYHGLAPGSRASGRYIEATLISGEALGEWRERVLTPPAEFRATGEELVSWGGMNNAANWPSDILANRRESDLRGLGVGLVSQLLSVLLRLGVEPQTNCVADRLIMSDGRVVGVETVDGRRFGARRGVVIASGGYESSTRLTGELERLPGFVSMFPRHITGDGIVMGQEAGAALRHLRANMSLFLGYEVPGETPFFRSASIIEMCSPHTIVVNRMGKRFADESYFPQVVPTILHFDPVTHSYPNLPCFLLFDQQYVDRYSIAGAAAGTPAPDWVPRAGSLTELAGKLGIDAGNLGETIQRFNGFAERGVDEDFQRGARAFSLAREEGSAKLGKLACGPFYGIELRPSSLSSAGLATDGLGRVLHLRGHPIPGLYASGNAAAHTEYGAGYQAGHSLMSGMTFSLLAARQMAAE
jgi:3-oxosteroid 1-dehydrogenase